MVDQDNDLTEPLLADEPVVVVVAAEDGEGVVVSCSPSNDDDPQATDPATASDDDDNSFSYKTEFFEMANLGIPLAVSFFCRMGMASTDSSFVGHISNAEHSAETYLAAAVLSDMIISLFVSPPLAFNQVLNALVGQSMGSGNPKMAGIWLQQSCFWLTVSMLPCLTGFWYVETILKALDFPETVAEVAGTYAKYNLIWPIPNGLYQCMRFYFQAQGKPQPAMYNNILFLFVNAFLNWIFVFGGPFSKWWGGFGFIGAAISLSISRTLQPVTYFCYMFWYKQHHKATWPEPLEGQSFLAHHTLARTCEFMKQSIPNIGTLLFQVVASQATTVLVGRLGELSIAASSALSTVTIPWSGSLSATCSTISGVRVGYHLGRGNGAAARKSTWMVLTFITMMTLAMSLLFVIPSLQRPILGISTNDPEVLKMAATLVPAMLVGTYLSLMVGNITGGVFGGMGRPLISTILSFGLELPMSIGGVAVYILVMHGDLLGVYWWNVIAGAIELVIVAILLGLSDWQKCAVEAQRRNEVNTNNGSGSDADDGDDTTTEGATTDPESGMSSFGDDENDTEEEPCATV